MGGRVPFYMDKTISDPWFDDMDRHTNNRPEEQPLTDWLPSFPNQPDISEKVTINNSKYYNLPCDCGLVDNIASYQKLRTRIYFDTHTKNFYKSDINTTAILPDGLPYMGCPRHSQYFSDVIRCHVSVVGCGEGIHQKIYLFDATSQHNYAIQNPTPDPATYNDDNQIMRSKQVGLSISSPISATNSRRGLPPNSPKGTTKHFISCPAYNNDSGKCNCNEHLAAIRQKYIRQNSVVADVLAEHGIDIVIPPEEFHKLNNPLFKNGDIYDGSRLARARWVRRDIRKEDKSPKYKNYLSRSRERSHKPSRLSCVDLFSSNPNRSMFEGNSSHLSNSLSYIDDDNALDYSFYRKDQNLPRRVITFNDSPNQIHYDNTTKPNTTKNATFTVLTRPKRHHVENDDFLSNTNNLSYGNMAPNANSSKLSSISQLKCGLPEDNLQRWVTVIGFQPRVIGQVIRFMNSFGPIIKIKSSKTCNYLHLMYSKVDYAENAIKKATIKLDNSMIISIKPCTSTFIPNEQVHCYDNERDQSSNRSVFSVSNYFSWFTSAVSKVVEYVDGFINEP